MVSATPLQNGKTTVAQRNIIVLDSAIMEDLDNVVKVIQSGDHFLLDMKSILLLTL
jgi:hypothetical protein